MSQFIRLFSSGGASSNIQQVTPDSGSTVTPTANNINVIGGLNITTEGTSSDTLTIDVSSTTDHAVQIGNNLGSLTSITVGTDGQILVGATGADPAFTNLTSSDSTLTITEGPNTLDVVLNAPVTVGNGGTGTSSLTDHGVLLGSGTAAVTVTSVGTDGQILIGATGADPAFANITSADGSVTITEGPNSLDLSAPDTGNVTGPGSSTDNAIARFDGTTGKIIQNSGVTISDADVVDGATQLNVDNIRIDGNTISSTNTNGNILVEPDGTGEIQLNDRMTLYATEIVVNEDGNDRDFRIEAVGSPNAFVVRGDNGNLGLGVADPDARIEALGAGAGTPTSDWFTDATFGITFLDDQTQTAQLTAFAGNTAGERPLFFGRRSQGTLDAPSAVASGDVLFSVIASGYDGSNFQQGATINFAVDAAVSAGTVPTALSFETGSSFGSRTEAMNIDSSQNVTLTNPLAVGSGGTGASTLTDHGVLIGSGTAAISVTGVGSLGQVLSSNGPGVDPSFQDVSGFTQVNIQKFTANGTYTPTSGMQYAIIEVIGGGGGSGGIPATSSSQVTVSGAGGAGGYSRGVFTSATIGASQSVTIGAGGSGGSTSPSSGSAGSASSVGSLIDANGGSGGASGAANNRSSRTGSDGGSAGTGGDINIPGQAGHPAAALYISDIPIGQCWGGSGGSTPYGFGGKGITTESTSVPGKNGIGFGSGGGSAIGTNGTAEAGGDGADGIVIITEYI